MHRVKHIEAVNRTNVGDSSCCIMPVYNSVHPIYLYIRC